MSIDEIKRYLAHSDIDDFMKIADDKINELNRAAIQIERTIAILEKETAIISDPNPDHFYAE